MGVPETSLNESCKTQGNQPQSNKIFGNFSHKLINGIGNYKRGKEVETKYISLDPFVDRKNSTRTDGDIRKFQTNIHKEDMRADFRQ